MKINRLLGIVTILSFGSLAGSAARAEERVRVALSVRNVVFLPFYYAKALRIYDKHGLNVELIQMRSDLQLAGLVSGEIDYTPSVGPAGTAIANSLPIKALAILYRAPLFSLVSPAGIANVKELEGKKVAVSRIGSESHRYGSLMIESAGADPEEGDLHSNRQYVDQPGGDPTGNRQRGGLEPAVYRHDGGKRL